MQKKNFGGGEGEGEGEGEGGEGEGGGEIKDKLSNDLKL